MGHTLAKGGNLGLGFPSRPRRRSYFLFARSSGGRHRHRVTSPLRRALRMRTVVLLEAGIVLSIPASRRKLGEATTHGPTRSYQASTA